MDQWNFIQDTSNLSTYSNAVLMDGEDSDAVSIPDDVDGNEVFALLLFSLSVVLSVIILIGNSAIMIAYFYFRSLRKVHNDFVISLTVANLLVGITAPYIMLRRFHFLLSPPLNIEECLFRLILTSLVVSISAGNLCAATVDRFIAVMFPLRYSKIITRVRTRSVIITLWIYNTVVSILPVFGLYEPALPMCNFKIYNIIYSQLAGVVNIFIPILGSVALYVPILITTRRHMRQIRRDSDTIASSCRAGGGQVQHCHKRIVQEARLALTIGLILSGFVLCWFPILIFPYIGPLIYQNMLGIANLNSIAILLSFSYAALCPVIYGLRNREFRHALRKLLNIVRERRPSLSLSICKCGSVPFKHRDRSASTRPLESAFYKVFEFRMWRDKKLKLNHPGHVIGLRTPGTSSESLAG